MKALLFSILCLSFVAGLPAAQAQPVSTGGAELELTIEQESRAAAITGMLKCPVCKSQSLAASNSFLAEEMKRQIRQKILDGQSDDEILDYFVERYTEWILLKPRARGWQWLLYVVPAVGIVIALGFAFLRIRVDVSTEPRTQSEAVAENDAATLLLEKEIEL